MSDAGIAPNSALDSAIGTQRKKPTVERITVNDLKEVLARGWQDTLAYRTDVFFLTLVYPVIGLLLITLVSENRMIELAFPLLSGFALIGPVAAVGLYEMSRRREAGEKVSWWSAFGVVRSRSFGAIFILGLVLTAIFALWIYTAYGIYNATLGPEPPASIEAFARDVFRTEAGWRMMILGVGVGFLFAVVVLSISVVSFPLLLDREVGVVTAVGTSLKAVAKNPVPMAVWGMIVAGALALGSLPLLLGLILIMPVLGHGTWHLYRKMVS
jgi:uncharacterized membrane protein